MRTAERQEIEPLAPAEPGVVALAWGHVRGVASLGGRTLRLALSGGVERREFFRQLYIIGNQSLSLVFGAVSFTGMIMVAQAGLQLSKFIGELSLVGPIIMPLFIREFAPTMAGLMIATRVGAGIAAELGSMKTTEQLDALRMCRTDPVAYLVVPRLWAALSMTVVLALFAIIISIGAGSAIGYFGFGVNPRSFANLTQAGMADLIICLMKSTSYGLAVPLLASYCGMQASGGAEGVGTATTQSVVACSTAVIALDLIISIVTMGWV